MTKTVSWATKNEVVGRLRMAGLSMKDFAVMEGYASNTVRKDSE
jgi:lambda repressor-like predicted transcriptional regulator